MSARIESFYRNNGVPIILLKQKLERFERNKDIAEEFEYWIEHRHYKPQGCVIEGYSAEKLAEISEYLDGEGAFVMLIELREEPKKAFEKLMNGFKKK